MKPALKNMSVAELIVLRDDVQAALSARIAKERSELQKQIDALAILDGQPLRAKANGKVRAKAPPASRKADRKSGAPVKRRGKVPPKFRGPGGETWSGRGNAPRWLVALEADGKKRESFLIRK